jgi:hypothetical protein
MLNGTARPETDTTARESPAFARMVSGNWCQVAFDGRCNLLKIRSNNKFTTVDAVVLD